jgi:hypothetical protein
VSLMQLLVAGRSLKTVKDQPSPYKMKQANLLPKFAGKKTDAVQETQGKAAAASPEAAQPGMALAASPGLSSLAGATAADIVNDQQGANACADFPQPVIQVGAKQPVLRGWYAFRKRLQRSRSSKVTPVQTELSLDTVRVVRNDLRDVDPANPPAGGSARHRKAALPRTRAVAGAWWTRLQMRLFARREKEI